MAVDPALAFTTVSVEVHPADGAPSRPSTSDLESMVPDMSDSLKHVGGTVDGHDVTTMTAAASCSSPSMILCSSGDRRCWSGAGST